MKRRDFLKTIGLGAASLAMPGHASDARLGERSREKPNIILIMADDFGYECLGCNGGTSYKTPVIDELARTGARFDHCHAQPLCTPSRVQIMTGKYNFRNYTVFGSLDPKEKTFGHMMQKAGYAACVVGKWQLYGNQREDGTFPDKAGFDEYCLWQVRVRELRYADPTILINGKLHRPMKGKYGPDVFCDYMLDFIERQKDKPFFVYYPMALTHAPFQPTPDSEDWNTNRRRNDKKYFADMVAYMDKIIGRIVNKLDEMGLRERTLLLFTGDNGSPRSITSKLGDREIKGGKGLTIDTGTHVPLVANWKGTTSRGKVCSDLVDFTDFLPTLADAAGIELPRDTVLDGRSFFPQLRGKKGNPRDWIYCYYKRNQAGVKKSPPKIFARDKRFKLYADGRLFNVIADPLEASPIKPGAGGKQASEARARLQAVLDSMARQR
jgi:arylsulfatase A